MVKETKPYVVILPLERIEQVPSYRYMAREGVTYAESRKKAVGNLLHRNLSEIGARTVQKYLNNHGGSEHYALDIINNYEDTSGKRLNRDETRIAQEIEVSHFIESVRRNGTKKDPKGYHDLARDLLDKLF